MMLKTFPHIAIQASYDKKKNHCRPVNFRVTISTYSATCYLMQLTSDRDSKAIGTSLVLPTYPWAMQPPYNKGNSLEHFLWYFLILIFFMSLLWQAVLELSGFWWSHLATHPLKLLPLYWSGSPSQHYSGKICLNCPYFISCPKNLLPIYTQGDSKGHSLHMPPSVSAQGGQVTAAFFMKEVWEEPAVPFTVTLSWHLDITAWLALDNISSFCPKKIALVKN